MLSFIHLPKTRAICRMRCVLISSGLSLLFVTILSFKVLAQCEGDFDVEGDVDGGDVAVMAELLRRADAQGVNAADLAVFAADFGRRDCPLPPAAPPNLFNIGNSIGEGEAAEDDIGVVHHETVWSTGYDGGDSVDTLNERFKVADPAGYYQNDDAWDGIYNQAESGAEMVDFAAQANAMAAATGATPSGTTGMVTVLLGNNDVCSADSIAELTNAAVLDAFQNNYRAGLNVLAASPAVRDAYIHVSGLPDIYWLWIAKRSDFVCRYIIWPFVPCQILLENPGDDCASSASRNDPDMIYSGDGNNCVRRKLFHAAIRDHYNPILRYVLMEYKIKGLLPNAYYVDIFDIRFDDNDVNDGDCFHPSTQGHARIAAEQWIRSPWRDR